MLKLMLRDTRANLGRLFMSILAVALGVAFLAGTLSLRDVLSATFSTLVQSTSSEDITVSGPEQSLGVMGTITGPVSEDIVDDIREVAGVEYAYALYGGQAMTYDSEGKTTAMMGAPGLAFNYQGEVDEGRIVEGREARGDDEIMMELSTATRSGVAVGDEVTVYIDGAVKYEVVGIFEFGTSMAGASIIYFSYDKAKELFGPDAASIGVYADDSVSNDELRQRIADHLDGDYTVKTQEEMWAEVEEQVDFILNAVNAFLLVFVGVAFAISIFIITNTFTISVKQRQRQFALYRALGASPGQVFGFVIAQAIIIGVLGSALGLVLGQGLLMLNRQIIENMGMPLDADLIMEPKTMIASVIIGVIVTLVAAVVPSRNAALTPPLEAMRETSGSKERPLIIRGIVAVVIVATGAILTWIGSDDNGPMFGTGAALLFVGVIAIMPVLIRPFVAVLGVIPRGIAPATATVATRSLVASPRKTAMTATALAIGIALVAAGATTGASMRESVKDAVDDEISIDLMMIPNAMVRSNDQLADEIEALDDVVSVNDSTSIGMAAAIMVNNEPINNAEGAIGLRVTTTSSATFAPLAMTFTAGDESVFADGQAIITADTAEEFDWAVGDQITLFTGTQPMSVQIGAIVANETSVNLLDLGNLILPRDFFDDLNPATTYSSMVFIDAADGADLSELKEQVQAIVADEYVWTVIDRDDVQGMATQQVDMMLTFLYMLLGLSIVIAVLGIINTLILSVSDRVREIGLLRAVGLQRAGVRTMITQESVITTVIGAIVGLLVGVGLGLALVRYTAVSDDPVYVIPWTTILAMFITALVVGVLAALIPAHRAANVKVLEAIASE